MPSGIKNSTCIWESREIDLIRILHSVSNMDRAGIETMLMNYYRHMDRSKIQFDFLCNKKKTGAYDQEILEMGGKIFRTPGLNPMKYPLYLKYMKALFKQNPEYKILEAHNGALGVYALHAAKRNHIPVRIFHAHGASITRDWKMPLKLFCKSRLLANINQNYTCGHAAAKCYFGKSVAEKKQYVLVPNAIEVERFLYDEPTRNRIRKSNGLDGKHVIGHIGRFMTQKNHTFLLEVFAKLLDEDKDAYLVLLGDGELLDDVKEKAKRLGIDKAILFVGNVGNANEWYQAFDAFILPSIWEGLPVVGVEAQAADLPCVFSTSITEEVKLTDKVQFIGLEQPIQHWVQALKEALTNCERRNNATVIADKGYDIKVEAIKLQERYLKLSEEV